jgi:hypothetical protein
MEKKTTVEIPSEEMVSVESRFYTCKSCENLLNILSRQLRGCNNSDAKEILLGAEDDYKKASIDLNLVQSAIIEKYFGSNKSNDTIINFDFITNEVTMTWQE